MQKRILWVFLLGVCVSNSGLAETDCSVYEAKIRKLEDLRRQGGSLKQMQRWRMQTEEATSKKFSCRKESAIQIASGNTASPKAKPIKSPRIKLRKNSSEDPQVQQLLSTCNYWIDEYNNNQSDNNSAFRNTACRALDKKLATKEAPTPIDIANVRSLKECIKPNNLIDNDVQECRQGLRNPVWATSSGNTHP